VRALAALSFAMVVGFTACSPNSVKPSTATSPPETSLPANCREISPIETEALLKAKPDLEILDMRVETEWGEEGHIQGAQLANFYRKDVQVYLAAMDRTKPYLVYCAIGERSKQTAVQMAELGFKEVYVLAGGLNAWKAAGKPVVK
jgi:rhodanese-related sulfurtransferase